MPPNITTTFAANPVAGGAVTATVGAQCNATPGLQSVYFDIADLAYGRSSYSFQVNVIANPTCLGNYPPRTLISGATSTTIPPTAPPSDNGTFTVTRTIPPGFTGNISVNQTTGELTIQNPTPGQWQINVTVTDVCGLSVTKTLALTVTTPCGTPQNLVATATSGSSITVNWSQISCAATFEVWRATPPPLSFSKIADGSSATTFVDNNVAPNTVYAYRLRALLQNPAALTGFSTPDIAITSLFTDPQLQVLRPKALHLTELRTAVGRLRTAAGLPAATYTDPTLSAGMVIKAIHIAQLRTALEGALTALNSTIPANENKFAMPAWTDPNLAGVIIKAVHFQQIRDPVK